MNRKRRLATPPTSTGCAGSANGSEREGDIEPGHRSSTDERGPATTPASSPDLSVNTKPGENLTTDMILCSCFAHISLNRNRAVQAWLNDRPWHVEEAKRQRCKEDCSGCALVLVRSIFQNVLALEEKLLKELLTSLAATVFPEVCRWTSWRSTRIDEEGFDKMLKLLAACSEPLESRAHIATVLASRLRSCLLALIELADGGDADLSAELRKWLIELDSSEMLSRASINAQRCLLRRMVTDTWDVRCRDRAVDYTYLV